MAQFSKRHYESIAWAMQEASPSQDHTGLSPTGIALAKIRREQWEIVRDQLCKAFSHDNGAFKAERFMRACEYGANVRARS